MYIRIQNSCKFVIHADFFEISSDVFNKAFRFQGLNLELAAQLLKRLHEGIEEEDLFKKLSLEKNKDHIEMARIVNFLKEKGFLINSTDLSILPPEDALYDRQVRFFNSFENNNFSGNTFNTKLQNRKVVIVGLGAYGSWLALHCARLGIKHIVGIDHDEVELSNLHRQIIFTKEDIGIKKSKACAKVLTASDDSVFFEGVCKKIEKKDDLLPYLENADLIFNAFGYYPVDEAENAISGIITKACIQTKTPMLCLSTNWIGPLYVPERSACYFCTVMKPEVESILKKVKKNKRIDKRAFCPIIAITCSLAALEAVRYLSGINEPSSIDGLRYIDPFHIEKSKFIPIEKNQNCMFCS